ncbi:hypothetical protein D1872_333170 [compost metagenome]
MHHAAGPGVVVELAQQRCEIAGGNVGERHHAGHHLIAHARGGVAGDRYCRGFGIF